MHIAYVHYQYGSDTALHHVRQFAAAARELGHRIDVHAVNLGPPLERTGRISLQGRVRQWLKMHLSRYLHEPKEVLWNPLYVRKELRLLRPEPPDVLLVRDHSLSVSCLAVSRRLRLPLVLECNAPSAETDLYRDQYVHLPWLERHLERRKLRQAHAVTVVSSPLRDFYLERYRVDERKFFVVHNGVDVERFHPDVEPKPALLRPDEGTVQVGYVGSFQKWHRMDLLAQLCRRVCSVRPDVRFLFVGAGPQLEELRSLTRDFDQKVVFTGIIPHDEMPAVLTALDVCVLPAAAFYMSPLKVPEWMAAGRAVVAPRQTSLAEMMEDGRDGLLFEPECMESLVEKVLRVIDDPPLRVRLGEAATIRARAELSWRENAAKVVTACEFARRLHCRSLGGGPERTSLPE